MRKFLIPAAVAAATLAIAAGHTMPSSPPRYAFIVAVRSHNCRMTRISTNAVAYGRSYWWGRSS